MTSPRQLRAACATGPTGSDLLRAIRDEFPEAGWILMSAYPEASIEIGHVPADVTCILYKPFGGDHS
ncbi:MAG: hypothetical protein ACYDDF_00445 [Thermoplasmatota archaeon]